MTPRLQLFLYCLLTFLFTQNIFAQQTNYNVLFHTGTDQLSENFKSNQAQLTYSSEEVFDAYYSRLIQFYANPNKAERQVMENMGLQFLGYVPHYTYIVAIPVGFDWGQIAPDKIRSVVAIDPLLKIDSKLTMDLASDDHIEIILAYPAFYNLDQIEEACMTNGITVMESSRYNPIMKVSLPSNLILQTAALPFISFLEKDPGKPILDDVRGRAIHRCNLVDTEYPSGYNFNGEGVNVNVRDDGPIGPHIDFQGRVDNSFQPGTSGSHETRVAGTLGGAGNIDPYAKGMADGAFMFGTDYESTFLDLSMDLHFDEGVVITNSSYSNGCNDGYMNNSATVDQQIYENPTLIHVFSAGNSNNSDCGYGAGNQWGNITGGHKVGKNAITTANIFYDGSIVESSSRGPAEDGRIKPDISAQGAVYAQLPNNEYQETNGTSFSSPSVAGVLAQLYQAYKTWNGDVNPPSALMKGCLLNTANDLGNLGPDFIYGWGHLNAYRAMKTIEEVRYFSDEIEEGIENQHSLSIAADVTQIKVMVYWSDVAGVPLSTKALVNNLDIQILTPAGDTIFPYLLDHTPNATALNTPATNGVDDLNNMEQIVIDNPVVGTGTYTLLVNGTEVPFGPQEYFVIWEEVTDELMLTWPNGGECLTTTLDHTIHWDARPATGNFLLEYSSDAGTSWSEIITVDASLRNYDWTPPTDYTGLAMIRVTRDGISDTSNTTFSLMDAPQNVELETACPDYITLSWDPVPDAVSYIAYILGSQYMDSVAMSMTTTVDVPIPTLDGDIWYAISSIGPDGACSPRTIAQLYQGSLFNCTLNNDVAMTGGNICPGTNYICEPFDQALSTSIFNNGLSDQADLTISYSLNNGPVVSEVYPGPLMPGETYQFTFSNLLNPNAGNNTLLAWVDASADEFDVNDTLSYSFEFALNTEPAAALNYSEDFESGNFPATGWSLNNPDGEITWEAEDVIGAFGDLTTTMHVNFYAYNNIGQRDELVTLPIDLTGAASPLLSFDVAYASYNANLTDTMLIRLTPLCSDGCSSDIIYHKYADELATHPTTTASWEPESADDWRNEIIDLSAYAGEQIILTFISATGYGNGLYFDNINVVDEVAPVAGFEIMQTTSCVLQPMAFTDNSTGAVTSYQWDFGADAVPASSNTAGPHVVEYSVSGSKTITLTVSGPVGDDTYTSSIDVAPLPDPSFTFTDMDATFTFTNTSSFGETYEWDFGDGNLVNDENPVHTYTATGTYTVVLSVSNVCGTTIYSETVSITIDGISDLENDFEIALSPNPGTKEVVVSIGKTPSAINQIDLYNTSGQLVKSITIESTNLDGKYQITTSKLPAGTYWFKLIFETGIQSRRWVKL